MILNLHIFISTHLKFIDAHFIIIPIEPKLNLTFKDEHFNIPKLITKEWQCLQHLETIKNDKNIKKNYT